MTRVELAADAGQTTDNDAGVGSPASAASLTVELTHEMNRDKINSSVRVEVTAPTKIAS